MRSQPGSSGYLPPTRGSAERAGPCLQRLPVRRGRLAGESGQASVELVAFVPLLVAITMLIAGLLAGYSAREAADQAAVAAAVAQLQGGDPKAAAREASPGWARSRVKVARGRATVVVQPRLPRFVAQAIDAERTVVFDEEAAR